jgi:hypothetical protein
MALPVGVRPMHVGMMGSDVMSAVWLMCPTHACGDDGTASHPTIHGPTHACGDDGSTGVKGEVSGESDPRMWG